jgi:hypothetical protein
LNGLTYEEKTSVTSVISVKDSIKRNINFWRSELRINSFIEDVIENGYKIPFETFPTTVFLKNNCSAKKHYRFVESAIAELVSKKCVQEVESIPFCVNPFSVNSSGKERLILDLRHINKHLHKFQVKFEGCKEALNYFHVGNLMYKFDLKLGYHHINIRDDFQKYLGFSWEKNGKFHFYVFSVLRFGISSAPFNSFHKDLLLNIGDKKA